MFERLEVKTTSKYQMIELLDHVKAMVSKHGVKRGIVVISVPHTTAALTLSKNFDPRDSMDLMDKLNEMVVDDGRYLHSEGNSAAKIKAALLGANETLIISDGHIELGMFQSIYLCEFDGPRKREVLIKIIEG